MQEVFLGGEFAVEAEELLLFFGEGLWVVVVVLVEGLGGAGGSGYARDGCTYADIDFVLLVRVHCFCYWCVCSFARRRIGGGLRVWLIQSKAVGVTRVVVLMGATCLFRAEVVVCEMN